MGSIREKAHILPDNAHSNSQHSSGAMDESSGKGSKMQAHHRSSVVMDIAAFKVSYSVFSDIDTTTLQAKSRARNVPSGRWRTCQGRFKMQTLTLCDAKVTSTRTAAGQFKG